MSDDMQADTRTPRAEPDTPATPERLFARLDELGIPHTTVTHDPVFTVAEAQAVRTELDGTPTKNLALRNQRGRMWLFVCEEDRRVDLKALAERLGAGRFSFASPRRLLDHLGIIPGAVSALAVINDVDRRVEVVFEKSVLSQGHVHCHPLDNSMTTTLAADDLVRFLEAEGHPPILIELD